jgi:hypothetical protein
MIDHGVDRDLTGLACSFEFPFSSLTGQQRQVLEVLSKRYRHITAPEALENFTVCAFTATEIESWLSSFLLLFEDRLYCTALLSVHESGGLL